MSIKHLFPLIIFFFVSCKLLTPGGCTDESACNYNPDIYKDNGSCYYPPEEYNCDGECFVESDCMGICAGTLVNDCTGVCGGTATLTDYWMDADGDGLGFGELTEFCDATVEEGWVLNSDDEDDTCFSNIHDCAEICDGDAVEDMCGMCDGDNSTCMVTVPSGDYTYGENDATFTIDYDFEISKYEITNVQYVAYLEEALINGDITVTSNSVTGYYEGDEHYGAGDQEYLDLDASDCEISYSNGNFSVATDKENHPVIEVTWYGANAFSHHYDMRLPNEYEWEKTARGNTGNNYPWGDNSPTCELANYYGCVGSTQEVGITTGISPYGAYDMAGNVWEWTDSWWSESSSTRVLRGGSWLHDHYYCHSWYRNNLTPDYVSSRIGFRVARTQ